jgi:hypothetical protein
MPSGTDIPRGLENFAQALGLMDRAIRRAPELGDRARRGARPPCHRWRRLGTRTPGPRPISVVRSAARVSVMKTSGLCCGVSKVHALP